MSTRPAEVEPPATAESRRRWWPLRTVEPQPEVVASDLLHDARIARRLLDHARSRLGEQLAADGLDGALRSLPSWLEPSSPQLPRPLAPPEVIAGRRGDGADRLWRHLGGDGDVRDGQDAALPPAVLRHERGTALTVIAAFDPGEGVDAATRRGAYLWVHTGVVDVAHRSAVFALEWTDPGPFRPSEVRALRDVRELLDERWLLDRHLEELRREVQLAERARAATTSHDQLGQDLAHIALELGLLARQHPEVAALEDHAAAVREVVGALRGEVRRLRGGTAPGG